MAACKTTLFHIRRALLGLVCVMVPLTSWATRRVPVFLVDVAGRSAPALHQAMRAALVRATGRPESATDPAFAPLVAQAPKYVVNYQRGPQGELQVAFDGAAVDRVITSLGHSVWSADRPFTLVVLNPMPDQADYQADHAAIGQAAEALGLPISIMPLPVMDASGRLLPREALLQLVHRFGAEQLLVGQPPAAPAGSFSGPGAAGVSGAPEPPQTLAAPVAAVPSTAPAGGNAGSAAAAPQWRWTLVTPFMDRSFTGSVTAGIEDTVALLAPPPTSAADRSGEARVWIEDVSTLADYAHIEVMLAAIPGVSRANVSEVQGRTAVFELQARGGSATIARMLAGSPHFARVRSASGSLIYRYRPGALSAPPASFPVTAPPMSRTPSSAMR